MKKLLLLVTMTVACLTTAQAAISVGASGSGTIDFNTAAPTVAEGWSTLTVGSSATMYTTAAALDAAAQSRTAAGITTALGSSGTVNPPSQNSIFRWNSVNHYIQSRPTGNDYSALLATFQNDTPGSISTITLTYDYGTEVTNTMTEPSPSPIVEDIPGHRVFWSLTGLANSWTLIPELSGVTGFTNATTNLSAVVNLGSWAAGTPLYVMWLDDNGPGGNTQPGNQEGVYTIDNLSLTPGGTVTEAVAITTPANGANVAQGVPLVISANATMAGTINGVSFYADGALLATDTTSPYSITNSSLSLGSHALVAVGTDNTHSITSATVNITINPNNPPTITVTNANTQSYLVGSDVINYATTTDSDSTVARVEFYLDGVLKYTDTSSTYKYEYDDALVGTHTVTAVAVDTGGARGTNFVTFTITNPPNVTIILTNGATWKFLDNTNDPSLSGDWKALGFNDSGWSSGPAEIGFGDSSSDRPEVTQARRILTNTLDNTTYTNITFYFRKVIDVASPSAFSSLILNIKEDDGSIVYINGTEVYRATNMPAGPVNHGTFALSTKPDDGAAYYQSNVAASVLVAGQNIIAVEMHQDAFNSSDISFDLMLWGVAPAGPSLTITRINNTQAEITWPTSADPAQLYFKTDLNAASWTLETTPGTISGGLHHVIVNMTGNKFYTLRL